jgi:hypothetical protein
VKIIDRLPYANDWVTLAVRGERVRVKPYQIVVWVSLSLEGLLEWDPRTPHFPAILDTGNNHNFSIGRGQLVRWGGLDPRLLPRRGAIREGGQRLPLHAADLWLHPNRAGTRDVRQGGVPTRIGVRQGIAIYPDETAPRLPLLGLRALTLNRLRTVVDGDRMTASIRTAFPRWWPFA